MRIASYQVGMSAQHVHTVVKSRSEKLEVWVGKRPENNGRRAPVDEGAVLKMPPPKAALPPTGEPKPVDLSSNVEHRNALDLAILLRTLGASTKDVEQALRHIGVARSSTQEQTITVEVAIKAGPGQADAGAPQGWGLAYDLQEQSVEMESTSFQATGTVTTTDGRTIAFNVVQAQARVEAWSTSISIRAGDAKKVDPLVLNLTEAPVVFQGSQSFDLNSDGEAETIAKLDVGHAYLALDYNGNGIIDDGSELFGPTSGDGFRELAAQDSDGNGWIDEADPVFAELKLWSPAEQNGGELRSLLDGGVGAIALQNVSTPFTVKAAGATQGYLNRTGIFLRESGEAGTIQHVDLVV